MRNTELIRQAVARALLTRRQAKIVRGADGTAQDYTNAYRCGGGAAIETWILSK
jgi:hypothetical protein